MPKISALPPMTTADAADEAPIVDTSATTTKKWTLTLLKTYLQSITSWVTSTMIGTAEVKATNLDFSTFPWEITGMYTAFYTRAVVSMTAGGSASDTPSLPRAVATGETCMVFVQSCQWCNVGIATPGVGATTVTATRSCTVSSAYVSYSLSVIYYKAH